MQTIKGKNSGKNVLRTNSHRSLIPVMKCGGQKKSVMFYCKLTKVTAMIGSCWKNIWDQNQSKTYKRNFITWCEDMEKNNGIQKLWRFSTKKQNNGRNGQQAKKMNWFNVFANTERTIWLFRNLWGNRLHKSMIKLER